MATFRVWLAADTLLYMPIYALADLGILSRVARAAGLEDATIEVRRSKTAGDRGCIDYMLTRAEAEAEGGDIHVAIADPTRAFQADPEGERASLIGALIKRPPFWEVGRHASRDDEAISHRYVYYDDTMATGSFLGRRLANLGDDENRQICKIGEEFGFLEKEDFPGQVRVVTADIRSMVTAMLNDEQVGIFKRLSQEEDLKYFVTSAVITHKKYSKNQGAALSLFMEAIRSACILLRTAEAPTAALVEQIILRDDKGEVIPKEALDRSVKDVAKAIAHQIFAEGLYADSLSISHREWAGALKTRLLQPKQRRKASQYFFKIYNPKPSRELTADWLIKAIKDYGRFAKEAQRLRGTTTTSIGALVFLVGNTLAYERIKAGAWPLAKSLEAWLPLVSICVGSGMVTITMIALLRDRIAQLIPLQRLVAMDDELATSVLVGLITVPTLLAVSAFAKYVLHLEFDVMSLVTAVTAALVVTLIQITRLIRAKDA